MSTKSEYSVDGCKSTPDLNSCNFRVMNGDIGSISSK